MPETFISKLNGTSIPFKKEVKVLRAVIYGRVSSEEQAKKNFSIPEIQIPESKKLIAEYEWKYVNTYIDEGYDGNTFSKRPSLQRMLDEDIDTFDVVVVYSFDRLVRDDPYIEAQIYKILDGNKKQITSVLQRVEILDPDEYDPKSLNVATQRRFRGIQIAYDSLTRRQRYMDSRKKTARQGRHIVVAPFGYKTIRRIDPKDPRRTIGYKTPDKKEVPTLQRMFKERAVEGKSYKKIAIGLNEDKIRTRSGTEWSSPRIRQVLTNPFSCGYIVWNKTQDRKYGDKRVIKKILESEWEFIPVNKTLEKYYKPLIKEEMFLKAREIGRKNSQIGGRAAGSSNILSGLVKCSSCGHSLVETSFYKIKDPPYKRGYYVCSDYVNKGLCSKKKYPSWFIKLKVLKKVKAFLDDPQTFKKYLKETDKNRFKEQEEELKDSERKLKQVQKRIGVLNLKYLDGKIKEKYYLEMLPDLEKTVKQLTEKVIALKKGLAARYQQTQDLRALSTLSEEIRTKFESLNSQQQKIIIRTLVEEIIPNSDAEKAPKLNYFKPAIMEQRCSFQRQL